MACIKEGSIGGGDIKLMGVCGFFLRLIGVVIGSVIGLVCAVIFNGVGYVIKCKTKITEFALAPYIGFGCILRYYFFILMV